ncbi:hypothetical protein PPERSA_04896 [Pseudocohnilembus persalinus]|uniref:Transmembrane protein n=1 Tax=Pseudocohnilembus persalinus TaxID=266149 RepID=A0A0V0QJ64_PSEPJ|nr:hypothetical protein PPERSA_04896 [Pseudocohnilembus persalinus]|eukprot:KRX02274.1 hypothetical protein PPERSA_04896 [Pseudocohnilembus persalinus]
MANFDGSETYGALGIRFTDQNGNDKLGMGCFSSKKHSSMVSAPYTYSDYKRGHSIACGSDGGLGVQIQSIDNLDSPYYTDGEDDSRRILKVGGSSRGGSRGSSRGSSYSSKSYRSNSSRSSKKCNYQQNWIGVKLPAWNCIDMNEFKDDIRGLENQLVYDYCYYDPYYSKNGADKSSKSDDILQADDFYMLALEDKPYYNKVEFLLFVIFFWIPFLAYTHFSWIPYIAIYLQNIIQKNLEQKKQNITYEKEREVYQKKNFVEQLEKEQQIKLQNKDEQVDQSQNNSQKLYQNCDSTSQNQGYNNKEESKQQNIPKQKIFIDNKSSENNLIQNKQEGINYMDQHTQQNNINFQIEKQIQPDKNQENLSQNNQVSENTIYRPNYEQNQNEGPFIPINPMENINYSQNKNE